MDWGSTLGFDSSRRSSLGWSSFGCSSFGLYRSQLFAAHGVSNARAGSVNILFLVLSPTRGPGQFRSDGVAAVEPLVHAMGRS